MGPPGTLTTNAGSASSPAAGQIVPADPLDMELDNLMDNSMISVEDFIQDAIVQTGGSLPISSGAKAHATQDTHVVPSSEAKADANEHTQIVPSSGAKAIAEKSSSSKASPMAEENAQLRK